MKARALASVAALLFPAMALAQNPRGATYITADQVTQPVLADPERARCFT